MSKKISIVILTVVIAFILSVILYFSFVRTPKVLSAAMRAVSPKTALLIEVKNYYNFSKQLREKNNFWPELIKEQAFADLNKKLISIDSTLHQIKELDQLVNQKPLLIALSIVGKSTIYPTYIIETNELTSPDGVSDYLKKTLQKEAKISSREYQNAQIFTIDFLDKKRENIFYAFYKGLFISSRSILLVEESIRQVDNSEAITDNSNFRKVNKTSGENVDMNIYIQYNTFARLFKKYINKDYQKAFQNIMYFGNWTELDVNIEKQSVFLNGFTQSNDSSNNYLNIFKGQSSGTLDVKEILPTNSSMIMSLNLSDIELFLNKQDQYFERKGQLKAYKDWFEGFKEKYNFDIEESLKNIVDNEITQVYTQINPLDLSQNTYFILETKGKSQTMDELMPLLENWAAKKQVDVNEFIYKYKVKEDKTDLIYSFPKKDLASKWLGRMFLHAKTSYFTFIDDYLIFGNSIKDLTDILDANERKAVLENDSYFKELQDEIASSSVLYFYVNIAASKELFNSLLSPIVKETLNQNFAGIKKFQALVLQVGADEEMLYSNLLLKYNPVIKEKPRTIWESKLDTNLSIKPQIVLNHRNGKKEIFVQDLNHTIYLISESGKILWQQRIDGEIMSKVYQIDYYKNNKLQYLFNTKDKIYILDRNGNAVEQFPVLLRAEATAGIAVFDYDGSRDYRFFIPCKDKKIYVYNIEGKILPGWVFEESEAYIKTPIQHFRIEDRDYILASDKNKIYILNRKGEEKIHLQKTIQKSINNPFFLVYKDKLPYFASTHPDGTLFMINEQGNIFEKQAIESSPNHYVLMTNLNDNPLFDIIYSDEGEIKILYDLKKEFTYDLDGNLSPAIPFEFSAQNKKIGVTNYSNRDLYLFNGNGTIYKNFPLKGATQFSISLFGNGSPRFKLIVGSSDGFLYNYEVP